MTSKTMRAALAVALLTLPAPLLAQRPPNIEPVRPSRFLAIGSIAYLESTTTLTTGLVYQVAFRTSSTGLSPVGTRVERFPRYYAHVLATGGAGYRDEGVRFAGYAQLGVARRNDSALFTTVALAAQAVHDPRAIGPVARVEIMDNLGLQAGWVFVRGDDGGGLFVSFDYMRRILEDLGLKKD